MLRHEEENNQTDTIQVKEYNKINIADFKKHLKMYVKKKLQEQMELTWNL
jgi:hypothetical protein